MEFEMMKRGSVQVDSANLAYLVQGQGPSTLVVGSSIFYPRTFSERWCRKRTMVFADLPHFVALGSTFPLKSITFEFYARCIESIRRDAKLSRVAVIGHSHHGNIALEYARRYPEVVTHVVLLGTPPVDVETTRQAAEHYWQAYASPHRRRILTARRAALESSLDNGLSPQQEYVAHYVADAPLYWHDPDYDAGWLWKGMNFRMDAIGAFRGLFDDYTLQWDPGELKAPVLAIMGRSDFAVPPTLWDNFAIREPAFTCRILDECGHTPQLERPKPFDALLLDWLSKNR
jgi:proline iminopeptidase